MLADKVQGAASQLQTYASEGGGSSKGGDSVDEAMRRRVLPRLRELASAVQEQVVGEVMERQQTSLVEMEVRAACDTCVHTHICTRSLSLSVCVYVNMWVMANINPPPASPGEPAH